ncbi:MAG: penicillin-binding protein 2 [Proteobacteria bacterium]|nr:penicillin-binding protein 2 [Pseudomonadota bacterium]
MALITESTQPLITRLWLAAVIVSLCACLLLWRWTSLQVEQFSHFSELAHENQVKLLPLQPPRGLLYDRYGEQLAGNSAVYSIHVASDFAAEVIGKIDTLNDIIDISPKAIKQLRAAVKSRVYKGNIVLREKLTEAEITKFLSWQFLFPEIVLNANLARYYPYQDSGGHILGFVGRINNKDIERLKEERKYNTYNGARFIGKTGVELINEDNLRGTLGSQEARVDAHGRILASRVIKQPLPGKDLYLTVDWQLQQLGESLLAGERGAAVMLDVHSGEILVLASNPRFDINKFVFGISQSDWDVLNHSQDKPLIHRAIYGQYSPGSTIKPFLALASLQQGWRALDYEYFSRGFFKLSSRHIFHDWKKGGHGKVDVTKSIVRSVNSYYYQLGHDVGIDKIHDALSVFGFGSKTGLDLDNEKPGVLPSSEWKRTQLGETWYPGDTIAASVGQGYMQVTPLQIARAMAMLANGGKRVRPYLVQKTKTTEVTEEFDSVYLQTIQKALAAVTRPGGTAVGVGRDAPFLVAGKTGTAQVSRLQLDAQGERIKNKDLPKHLRDHAWFVGYAPADAPQVAVAVIVENSGSGGRIAGPVVRQLLDAYMAERLPQQEETEEVEEVKQEETENAAAAVITTAGGDV